MTTGPNHESRVPNPRTLALLIEIGCEEIPARFLSDAQKSLGQRLREALEEKRLLPPYPHSLQSYSTPRRLVVHVHDVLEIQRDTLEEVIGPPLKVAFDKDGKPTRAAESFAARNRAEVQELVKLSTAKGEYVGVRKSIAGRFALQVLPEILPDVVTGLSFPKSMYWEKSKTRFIRPIRWLLAVLGEGDQAQVVHFGVAGVESGNQTRGHRILESSPTSVTSFEDYSKLLGESLVEFDPDNRRGQLRKEVQALLEASRLNVIPDSELEDWVVNSTEWPRALLGSFNERFLRLPREILITVMRDHQKYFAVEDRAGNLQPKFVASLNLDCDPKGLIRAGHERVLAARFADAEFFWNTDQKVSLADRPPMLERVTYQVRLGSYGDKVRRMEAIASRICRALTERRTISGTDRDHVLRAVQLSKCDLTTQMVQEFPELQGVVGGLYAEVQGQPEPVCQAIYDHYFPLSTQDRLPRSVVGATVSLADKLDSVIAGFFAGLEPTGSSDPFGLRRAGNGIIKLSIGRLPGLNLLELLKQVHEVLALEQGGWFPGLSPLESPRDGAQVFGQVAHFLRERAESHLETVEGLRYDTVRAVIQAKWRGWERPADALARGRALERIRDGDDFVALSTAAKRTRNILSKSAKPDDLTGTIDPIDEELLAAGPEEDLYRAYNRLRPTSDDLASRDEYEEAFHVLASLRPQVDAFFDKVLVMDNDIRVRRNRLNLLSKLNLWVFQRFADLSQIESKTPSFVGAPTSGTGASEK